MFTVRLKPGKERSLLRRHPWVFSGAVQDVNGSPGMGETVRIVSSEDKFLAWGAFSPFSRIQVRIWSWDSEEVIDASFIGRRIQRAISQRLDGQLIRFTDATRLVYGESDGLPGVVVDRYGDLLVIQLLSAGAEYWRTVLGDALSQLTGCNHIYERSDADVRGLEGLPPHVQALFGSDPPETIYLVEHGLKFQVDVFHGQKTGFYLDQRQNRLRLRDYTVDREVLDCFSYSGGFLLNALAGGARSVLAIESSATAVVLARQNVKNNNLPSDRATWQESDVFHELRTLRDQGRSFDLIILDPPKFAPTVSQVERAARGYKDINLLAFKLLRPGGILFTFSCSGGIGSELFQKIVASAAVDAGVEASIVEHMHQDVDHPIALNFPEGEYLKGLVIRKK